MSQENRIIKPELPPPDLEAEANFKLEPIPDDEGRQKRKIRLFLILLIAAAMIGALLIINNTLNFYDVHMRRMQFDYREGELVSGQSPAEPGKKATEIAGEINGRQVSVQAEMLLYNSEGEASLTLSAYTYKYTSGSEELSYRTGTKDLLFTKSGTLRRDGTGLQKKSGSSWEHTDDGNIMNLYGYCFAAADFGKNTVSPHESYYTEVGGKTYLCEIWLMAEELGSGGVRYNTLYRYYDGDRLAAVRVLKSDQELMEVYEIKDYSFG